MENLIHIIDGLIGIVVLGFGYWASGLQKEVKRIEILLNRTREDYASRSEVSDQITRLSESMIRLESKLDRVLEKK
tara:strand:- start:279 stop:506 length:228 start_codon:yes stop_codon:yes gene_type:complete